MALSRGLARLLALTCGLAIANVYYAQPLLHTIAKSLGTSQSATGVIVTATQLGFAGGLLLVVPLGDIVARRPLITVLLGIDALALAATAAAPGLHALAVLAMLIGASSVVVQIIIPYAATVAHERQRATTIGVLMGVVLLAILLSRTFAGVVAGFAGWRGVYAVAAGLMAVTALVIGRVLPSGGRELHINYLSQMRAILYLARREPVLRWRALIGAAEFAAFSSFWTTVTFLLSAQPYHYSQTQIGLFALVGAAGAGCALAGGRLLDRHRRSRWRATGAGIALLLGSFAILAAATHGLVWLVVGALLMDACCQGIHVANQAVIYDLVDAARSRVTTIYMTFHFIGGALGTTAGTIGYTHRGWAGSCVAAAGCCLIALLGWLASRRYERPQAVPITTSPVPAGSPS
jgi:predicted MFS family arabinose efflux permease